MSRKTKAELELENAELLAENLKLWSRIEELDGQLDYNYKLIKKLRVNFDNYRKQSGMHQPAQVLAQGFEDLLKCVPDIQKTERSDSARKAANERHNIPIPTVEALKKDFQERQKRSPEDKPTTIYKAMAKAYIGKETSWRRIRSQVQK